METTKDVHDVIMDDLPFNVERKNSHLELTAKPPQNLSGKKLKKFESKKKTVELYLFTKEDIEKLNSIEPIDYGNESLFGKFLSSFKSKVTRVFLSDI